MTKIYTVPTSREVSEIRRRLESHAVTDDGSVFVCRCVTCCKLGRTLREVDLDSRVQLEATFWLF